MHSFIHLATLGQATPELLRWSRPESLLSKNSKPPGVPDSKTASVGWPQVEAELCVKPYGSAGQEWLILLGKLGTVPLGLKDE